MNGLTLTQERTHELRSVVVFSLARGLHNCFEPLTHTRGHHQSCEVLNISPCLFRSHPHFFFYSSSTPTVESYIIRLNIDPRFDAENVREKKKTDNYLGREEKRSSFKGLIEGAVLNMASNRIHQKPVAD